MQQKEVRQRSLRPSAVCPHMPTALSVQDFYEDIQDEDCKKEVHKQLELAAQDIRFNIPLAEACYSDRMELCADVPPVSSGWQGLGHVGHSS